MNARGIVVKLAGRICEEHGTNFAACFTPRQCKKSVRVPRHGRARRARDHVLHVVKWSTGWSYPEIGAFFGLDHTSVILACKRHEQILNGELT